MTPFTNMATLKSCENTLYTLHDFTAVWKTRTHCYLRVFFCVGGGGGIGNYSGLRPAGCHEYESGTAMPQSYIQTTVLLLPEKKTTRKTYLISFLTPFRSDILRIQVLKRSWATPESEVLSSSWICSEPSRVCGIMLQLYRISYMQHYHQLNLSVCLSVSFQLKKTWLRMRDSDPVT